MPAIGNLNGTRQRAGDSLAIAAASITGHDADPRVPKQPCFGRRLFPIGQQRHDAPAFQVADDRAVAMVALPGPIGDPDHGQRLGSRQGAPPDDAEQRVVADRQHETLSEPSTGPTA